MEISHNHKRFTVASMASIDKSEVRRDNYAIFEDIVLNSKNDRLPSRY